VSDVTDDDWRQNNRRQSQDEAAAETSLTSWQLSSAEYGRDPVPLVRKKTCPTHHDDLLIFLKTPPFRWSFEQVGVDLKTRAGL